MKILSRIKEYLFNSKIEDPEKSHFSGLYILC